MDGRERFLCSIRNGTPDRCPLFLRDLTLALDQAGRTTPEVCSGRYDGGLSAKAAIQYQRRVGQDAVVGCIHHLGFDVEALGGRMDYPLMGIPSIVQHPFQGAPLDVLPEVDHSSDGQYPEVLRSYRLVSEGLPDTAVVCNTEGPLMKAATLRGLEALIMDLHSEPDYACEVIAYATGLAGGFLRAAAEFSDCFFIAAATDNPDLFGTDAFLAHSIPGVRSLVSDAEKAGLPTVFHPHGDFSAPENRDALEASISTGIDGFQFAEGNDQDVMREAARGRLCLLGGIDAHSTLLLGPERRIVEETVSCLERFRPWRGYVFMCSGSLHRGMPLENVDVMARTVLATSSRGP